MLGYQGESSRSSSQRQSGTKGSATQTGTASAAAKWATAVSTVTTRSKADISAAISSQDAAGSPGQPTGSSTVQLSFILLICSLPGPRCRLTSRTPSTSASGANCSKGTERN